MTPRLSGPNGIFPLSRESTTIGRDQASDIPINDPSVSKSHCRIHQLENRFLLDDCGSANGTFVNDKAIARRVLEHGDRIRVGEVFLTFLADEDAPPDLMLVDDPEEVPISTVRLPVDDAVFGGDASGEGNSQTQQLVHDMAVLLKLNSEINVIEESEQLLETLLDRAFEVIPADTGAILLENARNLAMEPAAVRSRIAAHSAVRVSRTITAEAMESDRAILRNNMLADGTASGSLIAGGIHSVLCVPLKVLSARIGVLYLDLRSQTETFNERHLRLAIAIANVGAVTLEHLRYVDWLESENETLTHEVDVRHDMIGQSPPMLKVYEQIADLADSGPVLIQGETGTGKELVARALHRNSARRNGPFVAVNCAAIAPALFESEVFGHEKGGFTGAVSGRKGLIEEAEGGTLFLDEIGELGAEQQAKLLRVLEDGKVRRVGAERVIAVDIRLVSATNRQLQESPQFRQDLYFRLGLPIHLPPLRERLEDIPLLTRFFIQTYRQPNRRELLPTPPETIRALQSYHWPGNVRELGRAIQWAIALGKHDRIRPSDLPPEIHQAGAPNPATRLEPARESFEKNLIVRALEDCHGNVAKAAALVGRAPAYLHRRITHLDLRAELNRIRRPS